MNSAVRASSRELYSAFISGKRAPRTVLEKSDEEEETDMLRIILIAHDDKKAELLKWMETRRKEISGADLFATWSTAQEIRSNMGLPVTPIGSDPAAADGRVRRMIEEGIVDLVVFLWDPRSARPHEVDADALLRLACDFSVPTALNPWTADYFLSAMVDRAWRRVRVPLEERSKCIA